LAQRWVLLVFYEVDRGSTDRISLVPLTAIGSTVVRVTTTLAFGWFVNWISSVVILDLCCAASLNSVLSKTPHIHLPPFVIDLPLG